MISYRFRQVPSSSKKEEFESYFRTPGFGGYHLLQLNDFPGQGTSPVGVVDVFYDAKPYVDAQTFKQMQSPCLPLLRTDKLVWTQNETFEGDAQMANFLKEKLKGAVVDWKLEYLNGSVYKDGSFKLDIPNGGITDLGKISIPLTGICQAAKMVLKMEIRNTSFSNNWAIWVYPDKLPEISEKK